MTRNIIGVLIPRDYEITYPIEVREFLDRFQIIRRIIPYNQDATCYHLIGSQFPEVPFGGVIPCYPARMAVGDFMKVIYI